jgi:hypothetical protein
LSMSRKFKLIPVYQHSVFIPSLTDLPGDCLDLQDAIFSPELNPLSESFYCIFIDETLYFIV